MKIIDSSTNDGAGVDDPNRRYSMSTTIGSIVGGLVGVVAAIFFVGVLIYVFVYKKKSKEEEQGLSIFWDGGQGVEEVARGEGAFCKLFSLL